MNTNESKQKEESALQGKQGVDKTPEQDAPKQPVELSNDDQKMKKKVDGNPGEMNDEQPR